MPTAPRTPAALHRESAERGLNDLGRLGYDTDQQLVEVLAALTHAVLALAPSDVRHPSLD